MSGYGPHREAVANALQRAFPSSDDLEQFTFYKLDLSIETLSGRNLPAVVLSLIKWAEQEGRERELITAARTAKPGNRTLEGIATNALKYLDEAAPLPWYESPNPLRTCFISSDKGLVNRVDLRDHVSELMGRDGARTLVVRGEAGSGRSYSMDFIRFIEGKCREFNVAYVDLTEAGADIAPDELIRNIAYVMGLGEKVRDIPPQQEQAVRWNLDLRAWLFGQLRTWEKPWWLVIDGIDQVKPRADTRDLIMKLVQEAETTEPLRVVLLACSEPLPNRVRVRTEEIRAITDDVLSTFFKDVLNHQGREAPPEAVDQAVQEVHRIVAIDPGDRLWLTKLSAAVALAAKQL
jgi:hypothetical protein